MVFIGEPYLSLNYDDIHYITDTGRNWSGKYSVKDSVERPSLYAKSIRNTNDLINILKKNKTKVFFITIHPKRWSLTGTEWTLELVTQSAKNIAKSLHEKQEITMNIFIITQEEPFFIPKIIQRISDGMEKEDKIVGVTILKPYHKGKNYRIWIKERAVVYLSRELFFLMILMIYVKGYESLAGVFPLKKYFSVKRLCDAKNLFCVDTADINSSEYLTKIRTLDIDVIISISATQIFKKALIDLPKKECVNIHGTLLPRHRGVMGSWWTLATGDDYTGVTVHRIIEKLDAGDIILQEKIPIQKDDTQFSLAVKTKKMSADLAIKLIKIIKTGNVVPKRMDQTIANINTFPTSAQAKQFRSRGKRVIKITDFPAIMSNW